MSPEENKYEVSDALPNLPPGSLKKDIDEGVRRFEVKQKNKKPTWRWVNEDEENA